MTVPTLDRIRNCLEGIIPSFMATCDDDGLPNASEISQVQYIDSGHVALSYQFFNKTRRNVLATRKASVIVVDPDTNAQYRLDLDYLETRETGPVFEAMRAKLAGIASYFGMQGVFKLLGADIYRVRSITPLQSVLIPDPAVRNPLSSARRVTQELALATDLGDLFDRLLDALDTHLGIHHAMVLIADGTDGRLFTVASRGYPTSGIGSEIAPWQGVIGVAANEGVPIRIGHLAGEYSYSAAIRDSAERQGLHWAAASIPYPGLAAPLSQIALPIRPLGKTIGVLFAEALEPNRFGYDDEDGLALVTGDLGLRILMVQQDDRPVAPPAVQRRRVAAGDAVVRVRHYPHDNSVFLDQAYLIKGVAGAIFWRLVSVYHAEGRTEFSNRELRLDKALRLPDYIDNLEARLLLLQRRLSERGACIQICKAGRGRFRLATDATLQLEEA
ncbi:pyridoxamine 5'-phosphate oxidase [Hoeflea marina]|uniref:Pyridoxamine 5'-phosphate oxidase n=1 Tax=Hoeflea marina TaxID=274592 RepID=A0A317PQK4_9HYPH|nr:GAF domain-containing protein [Hoeflea marina]PWW03742.1 pyridoxamine 5'-phosphate oxidase [Hoeflea marina]